MNNVMTGQAAAVTAAAQLSAHRRAILDTLVGCHLITPAEYATARQRTLACQDVATLQKWYRNTVREIARREESEPATAPMPYATAPQKERSSRAEETVGLLTVLSRPSEKSPVAGQSRTPNSVAYLSAA